MARIRPIAPACTKSSMGDLGFLFANFAARPSTKGMLDRINRSQAARSPLCARLQSAICSSGGSGFGYFGTFAA